MTSASAGRAGVYGAPIFPGSGLALSGLVALGGNRSDPVHAGLKPAQDPGGEDDAQAKGRFDKDSAQEQAS